MKIGRFINTVRHLRFRQIAGQVRYQLRRFTLPVRFGSAKPVSGGFRSGRRLPAELGFLPPDPALAASEIIKRGEFVFLNRQRELGWPPCWHPPGSSRIWLYNLHYFNWLQALDYPDCREAVLDWIENYPPSDRAPGWEPYPVSLRLINWLRLFPGKFHRQLDGDPEFRRRLAGSLHFQAGWLNRRLETRLFGNHLLENAVALTMAGNILAGREAANWRRRGLKILFREIREQILDDGLHFELSPMYHLRVTWLMLLLAAGGGGEEARPPAGLLERMLEALDLLTHPDGEIALLNDSALDIYPSPAGLRETARRLGIEPPAGRFGAWELPEAGYFGFRDREGNCLVCDAGPLGPDYLPAHGHGDIFSFELSLRGKRVVVDGGVSGYEPGEDRDYDRSTRAHNTVEIEGKDQAEFWGAFRAARRGRAREVEFRGDREGFLLRGWHDGYRRLPGSPVHHRTFRRHSDGVIEILDRIRSSRRVRAVSRVHLHPDCQVTDQTGSRAAIVYPGGRLMIEFSGTGNLEVEKSFYSPRFGVRLKNIALAFFSQGDNIKFGFQIIPDRQMTTAETIER